MNILRRYHTPTNQGKDVSMGTNVMNCPHCNNLCVLHASNIPMYIDDTRLCSEWTCHSHSAVVRFFQSQQTNELCRTYFNSSGGDAGGYIEHLTNTACFYCWDELNTPVFEIKLDSIPDWTPDNFNEKASLMILMS